MPLPSLPMISAEGWVRSCCEGDSPCVATAAMDFYLALGESLKKLVFAGRSSGKAKDRSGGGAEGFLIVEAHGSGKRDVASRSEGFGGTDERSEVARVLQTSGDQYERLGAAQDLSQREGWRFNQGGDALRGFTMDGACENLRRKRENFCFFRDAEAVEQRLASGLDEDHGKFKPAGVSFEYQVFAFNGEQAVFGPYGPGEGCAQFLHTRVLPTLYNSNEARAVESGRHGCDFKPLAAQPGLRHMFFACSVGQALRIAITFSGGDTLSAEILRIHPDEPEPDRVQYVVSCLRSGKVVGIPTDTFYGLAVDPVNLRAVERIYEIKSRLKHKPLSLLIANVSQAYELSRDLGTNLDRLAERFWPGPLTVIVKASSRLPLRSTANTGNVALRVPDAAIPRAVVAAFGLPITATSANLAGTPECTNAAEVREQLGDRIPLIVDGGPTGRSLPTTIVDLSEGEGVWQVLREGAISTHEIALTLQS